MGFTYKTHAMSEAECGIDEYNRWNSCTMKLSQTVSILKAHLFVGFLQVCMRIMITLYFITLRLQIIYMSAPCAEM